jgi:hypothetical protein
VTLPTFLFRTEAFIFSPKRAFSGTRGVPECEATLAELQPLHSPRSLPRREGSKHVTFPQCMIGLRALIHVTRPSRAGGYMQHPYTHGFPFFLGFPCLFLWWPLPCSLGCSSPAPSKAVLRSYGTFSLFSVLLCLATRTCLLLGVFLLCHLGLFGSFLPFLRKGLPESLGIHCCSLQSSYIEPTVPPLACGLSVSTSGKEPANSNLDRSDDQSRTRSQSLRKSNTPPAPLRQCSNGSLFA